MITYCDILAGIIFVMVCKLSLLSYVIFDFSGAIFVPLIKAVLCRAEGGLQYFCYILVIKKNAHNTAYAESK